MWGGRSVWGRNGKDGSVNKTKIEWCDYTWNPIVGCSPVSAGCENCYAAGIAKRFKMPWGTPVFMPDRLDEPQKVRKPSRVFVCSMSDLFHEGLPQQRVLDVQHAMICAPWHTYIICTKRPNRIFGGFLPNTIIMVSVENQVVASRLHWLQMLQHNWRVGVSVEPMIGPVTLMEFPFRPDWVIAGPETGPNARPCKSEWIDALAAESRCFFDKRKTGWNRREWPSENMGKGLRWDGLRWERTEA